MECCSNLVIDYNVYRNGVLYDNTTDIFYQDLNAEHDIEYCYVVSANYESGESQLLMKVVQCGF